MWRISPLIPLRVSVNTCSSLHRPDPHAHLWLANLQPQQKYHCLNRASLIHPHPHHTSSRGLVIFQHSSYHSCIYLVICLNSTGYIFYAVAFSISSVNLLLSTFQWDLRNNRRQINACVLAATLITMSTANL